ncbi:MAG: hypothetical protein U0794_18155 [Isosphaeraceae bacterium]
MSEPEADAGTDSPDSSLPPPTESTPEPTPTPPDPWTFVVHYPYDGVEPSPTCPEKTAAGIWAAASAVWHPALLALAGEPPRIEGFDYPSSPQRREVRIIAAGMSDRLPSGYLTQAYDAGTLVVDGSDDRSALIADLAAGSRIEVRASR